MLRFGAFASLIFAASLAAQNVPSPSGTALQTPEPPPARPVASNGDTVAFTSLVSPIGEPLQVWPPQRHLYDAAFACESANYLDIANDALEKGADPNLERLMPTKGLFGMEKGSALTIASYLAQQNEAKVAASFDAADLTGPIPEPVLRAREAASNCRDMVQLMKTVRAPKASGGEKVPVYAVFWRAEGANIRGSWGAGVSASLDEASAMGKRMCEDKTSACKPAGTCLMNPGEGRQWSAFVTNGEADRPATGFACGFPSYEEAQARAYRGCRYGVNLPRGFRCTTVWIRASDTIVDRGK